DFIFHGKVGGLLGHKVVQGFLERYGFGYIESTSWLTYSVSRALTTLLYVGAVENDYSRSVDDQNNDYLAHLKGCANEQELMRNMLQMASGVERDETYADTESDVATLPNEVLEMIQFVSKKPRVAEPGERFNYNTGESNLVGAVLRAAIGNNLA